MGHIDKRGWLPRQWSCAMAARHYIAVMFDFQPDPALPMAERYRQMTVMALALTENEEDAIANMANIAALMSQCLPDLNWVGFYRAVGCGTARELVLGPFIGRPACIRIGWGAGVCGAAAAEKKTQRVDNVHDFPGHIACDAASQSELVVPILKDGDVVALIDCDSPKIARFTQEDAQGMEAFAKAIAPRVAG